MNGLNGGEPMKTETKKKNDSSFSAMMESREIIEALDLNPTSIVLEYGAGQGRYTLPIARKLDELEGDGIVFALDRTGNELEKLDIKAVDRDLDHRIRLLPLTGKPKGVLPIKSNAVDRTLTLDTDFQSHEGSAVAREMQRILKPGGVLVTGATRGTTFHEGVSPQVEAEYTAKVLGALGFQRLKLIRPKGSQWAIAAKK
jgi:ubiquinone/menaquinone biosynthesis C-methylase UbiE